MLQNIYGLNLFELLRKSFSFLLLITYYLLLSTVLSSCGEKQTGPVEVKWDRDACKRCQMMVSDRKFGAQIRIFPKDKRSKVFKFDDIGCASLWLASKDQKQWQADPKTQIWVSDVKTGKWINAKTAWYIKDQITPMNYGLGAEVEKRTNSLSYAQAKKHIVEIENKLNIHGGNFNH